MRTFTRLSRVICIVGALCAVGVGVAVADPGIQDFSFAGNGIRAVGFGADEYSHSFGGAAVAIAPDGSVVVVGDTTATINATDGFAIAKLHADGSYDTSFSSDGRVAYAVGTGQARAVVVQPDGKIVVVGNAGAGPQMLVMRLTTSGILDQSFGSGGFTVVNLGGNAGYGTSVALQPDGKIVVGGYELIEGVSLMEVVRLTSAGSLDSTFGTVGRQSVNLGPSSAAFDLAVQPDGKIVAAGSGQANDFGIARLNPTGTLDTTFNGNGRLTTDFGGVDSARGVALAPDGKIVVAGLSVAGPQPQAYAIERITSTGQLDTTFNGTGMQRESFGGSDNGRDVVVQPDGKIVVGGYGDPNQDLVVARLNSDGSLDSGFGTGGSTSLDLGGHEIGGDLALQPDGAIVVGGVTDALSDSPSDTTNDLVVARVLGDTIAPPIETDPPVVADPPVVTEPITDVPVTTTPTTTTKIISAPSVIKTGSTSTGTAGAGKVSIVVTHYLILPKAFKAKSSGASVAPPGLGGTAVTFQLNAAAAIRFEVARVTTGRRIPLKGGGGYSCAPQTTGNKAKKACAIETTVGYFSYAGKAGGNGFHFTGRINGRKLPPGRYKLFGAPRNPAIGFIIPFVITG